MKKLPHILTGEKFNDKKEDFREALFTLSRDLIDEDNVHYLARIYQSTKQPDIRNKILRLLYDLDYPSLQPFFHEAYKKERYLDMKLYALRGLARFVPERDIAGLLKSFNGTLAKRQDTTPYNYQEYELLRGANALPYLVATYPYDCFKETLEQVEQQYNAMPDAFKGHFTTDAYGEFIALRPTAESAKMIQDFFEEQDS